MNPFPSENGSNQMNYLLYHCTSSTCLKLFTTGSMWLAAKDHYQLKIVHFNSVISGVMSWIEKNFTFSLHILIVWHCFSYFCDHSVYTQNWTKWNLTYFGNSIVSLKQKLQISWNFIHRRPKHSGTQCSNELCQNYFVLILCEWTWVF